MIEDPEIWIEADIERAISEDSGRKRVDRLDRRSVEFAQRIVHAGLRELVADPLAQLAGRLLGERDRDDLGQPATVPNQVDNSGDDDRGLARAGAGLEKERSVQLVDEPLSDCMVRRLAFVGGHNRRLRRRSRSRIAS